MIQMQEDIIGSTPSEPRQPAHSEAQEPAPVVPESETPATSAHEVADTVSGQPDDVDYSQAADAPPDEDDTAPDADEPGDDVAPEELEGAAQDAPNHPDEVDQEG